MTAPAMVSPVIGDAAQVLRAYGNRALWPRSAEARAVLTMHAGYLTDVLHEHDRLLGTGLTPHAEDEQDAIDEAEQRAADAARALRKAHAEYWRREEARRQP